MYSEVITETVGTPTASDMSGLAAVLGAFLLPAILIFVVFYCLRSYGLYRMAKTTGDAHAWLAWVPFARLFTMGKLAGGRVWSFGGAPWILAFGWLLGCIPVVGWVLEIAYLVYYYSAMCKLYKRFAPGFKVVFTVMSIIYSGAGSLLIFALSDAKPDDSLEVVEVA